MPRSLPLFPSAGPVPAIDLAFRPTVLDLFAGCGGFSAGFRRAGFDPVMGVDFDARAVETYRHNFGEERGLSLDLADWPSAKQTLRERLGDSGVDVIVAGPPCQGFSLTGPRNLSDPRNSLYMAVHKAVIEFGPRAFVIENVRGMASLYSGAVLQEIVRSFTDAGYRVEHRLLRASDYGVPQHRHRLFIVGWLPEFGDFRFPDPTHGPGLDSPFVTCGDALSDLASLEGEKDLETRVRSNQPQTSYQIERAVGAPDLRNHVATRHTREVIEVIRQVPPGGDFRNLPKGVGTSRTFNEAWTRYHPDRPSHTIDTGHRNHFHYEYDRVPTVRENARLQSFDDSFHFLGPRTSQSRQVGNAVPPLLAEVIASGIKMLFREQRGE
jgi:DNA (cytosine-5)-methyltransferase 1